jgi:hypothetical protein
MGQYNSKPEPEPKQKPKKKSELIVPERHSVELEPLLFSLEALPNDIILVIFSMLDEWSIKAILMTCKYFKSIIYRSNMRPYIKPLITVNYIALPSTDLLDMEQVRDLIYPLEYRFQNLGLPFSLEFKPVDPKRETKSSSGYSVNVLLWIEQGEVTDRALKLLRWFISKISKDPQTPVILLLKGDSIFSKHKELLQKVRKLSSLRVLGVIDGSPKCWSELKTFKQLELDYFVPEQKYRGNDERSINIARTTVWTINTYETTFIINDPSVRIERLYGETG